MKLSNDDINVLKNVLMYNNGIHFTPGNSIVSMSIDDSVIIKYSSPTLDIESSFAVYDLSTY